MKFCELFRDKFAEWFSGLEPEDQLEIITEGFHHDFDEDVEDLEDLVLYEISGKEIWDCLHNDKLLLASCRSNGWDSIESINEIISENIGDLRHWSFSEDFIDEVAEKMWDYNDPAGYFRDLNYGGCISGMVGMFIYHSDCKKFYIQHIDALEDFKLELEMDYDLVAENRSHQPHYTFMCWYCYENWAYLVAQILFEDEF